MNHRIQHPRCGPSTGDASRCGPTTQAASQIPAVGKHIIPQKPSDKIFLRLHRDAARDLAPHRESKADLDEPSSSLDSRCGARCPAASRCSLRKILSEGFRGTMCFPTARICDVAWVVGPHRDASPVLGTHRGGGFRWFIEFFLSRSHTW